MDITKAQLEEVYLRWEADRRAGKTLPIREVNKKSIEEVAKESANYLWEQLLVGRPEATS